MGERQFPVHSSDADWWRRSIPWSFIAPHEEQAKRNHGGQSLERLAERGGLSVDEVYAVVHNMPWRQPELEGRHSRIDMAGWLNRHIEAHTPSPAPDTRDAVRWVQQEEAYGCGCAAVAMLTGKTYQEVRQLVGVDLNLGGVGGNDWEGLLAEMGYATARLGKNRHHVRTNEPRVPWPPEPFGDRHLCEVLVPGGTRGSHMVVMLADGTVLDPLTPEPKRLADYETVWWVSAITALAATPTKGEE